MLGGLNDRLGAPQAVPVARFEVEARHGPSQTFAVGFDKPQGEIHRAGPNFGPALRDPRILARQTAGPA